MRKIVNFDKKIEFPSMIGEITSISLDQDLRFKDESNVVGKFIVKGTYKRTEASRLEEEFSFDIPTEIILTEKLDLETTKIDIDDFYYEIDSEDTITCFITILLEGMEIIEINEDEEEIIELEEHKKTPEEIRGVEEQETSIDEVRECDGDDTYEEQFEEDDIEASYEEAIEPTDVSNEQTNIISQIEEENELVMKSNKIKEKENIEMGEDVGSLFTSLKDSEETFSTYSVYILREEETVETILTKYKITKEELEAYNDINNIKLGSKIIIPLRNESD